MFKHYWWCQLLSLNPTYLCWHIIKSTCRSRALSIYQLPNNGCNSWRSKTFVLPPSYVKMLWTWMKWGILFHSADGCPRLYLLHPQSVYSFLNSNECANSSYYGKHPVMDILILSHKQLITKSLQQFSLWLPFWRRGYSIIKIGVAKNSFWRFIWIQNN